MSIEKLDHFFERTSFLWAYHIIGSGISQCKNNLDFFVSADFLLNSRAVQPTYYARRQSLIGCFKTHLFYCHACVKWTKILFSNVERSFAGIGFLSQRHHDQHRAIVQESISSAVLTMLAHLFGAVSSANVKVPWLKVFSRRGKYSCLKHCIEFALFYLSAAIVISATLS